MPELRISEADWNALKAETQIALLERQAQSWVIEYVKCATRHNTGADVYEGQLRDNVEPSAPPPPEPEKPGIWPF